MRLVTFDRNGAARLGVCVGDSVVDLSKAAPDLPRDLVALIRAGKNAFSAAERAAKAAPAAARVPLDKVKFLPPVPQPGKIICLGLNYVDHATEGGHAKPSYPSFFMRVATSLTAHGQPIVRPPCSTQLDYEAELAVVVGRRARHVREADALGIVAGYSCFNDGSLRDYQRKTGQWTIGKNFDRTGGFGPWMVTPEELPAGAAGLSIQSRLNGQVMQNANTRDMLFPVAETIVLLTECLTLEPGDVIVMGTPAGVGHARKPPVWMKQGDTIEIEIEGIGVLSNPIRDEGAA
ncbi:MAG: 5-oxopent-3-ene-1,2,5-tricarboxylate decarboxylase [Betaproteobacteria bacterium RBG_16_64_18]|nr:MAG: 5-oxopent-3-ene-1,2,5-tricarboxylate decarboxylase [Betaproteobacteria bacterium RBG_16_64_18]